MAAAENKNIGISPNVASEFTFPTVVKPLKPIYEQSELSIEHKYLLTIKEASQYFNIGENKLRELTNDSDCPFVLWNGNKRLIKRKEFEKFLDNSYSF